jgi:uncharacterized membrane protein YgdD (TMEM256/DUF423 family)
MSSQSKTFFGIGALLLTVAVMLGAFGAHSLENRLTPDDLDAFNSAVSFQIYHALGLIVVAFALQWLPGSKLPRWSGWLMVAGICFFSGSIYLHTFGAPTIVVMAAPVGGLSFMIAWALLAIAAFKSPASA